MPTEVALISQADDQAMRQEIHRYPPGQDKQSTILEYRSLNRATVFFENGAFSQGSIQWGPFSEFGAELGFIAGSRRLRIVQLFAQASHEFKQLTLIREQLKGTDTPEKPPLTLNDLIGTWQGEALTQYADLRPQTTQATQLSIEILSANQIRQTIQLPNLPPITSIGSVAGQVISFDGGSQPVQVLLLPDGASATCPKRIIPRQPLFLEAGWLIDSHTRQRMIRSYDTSGAWLSLTLVTEHKI
ncbi:MAG: protein of unknown function (DUF3598) [Phormidesmis priestleyi Ana]|uniref:Uncharacterized protein n=1 Tax=Phormidesmis priestleyi Ana TaxID=1666911 RepID=A0A0P7YSM2_9CYAN|nr:MAG: protein of unknown function (DUF3598) [Phormidesmis priestleyi Ana]